MKKFIAMLIAVLVLATSSTTWAKPVDFSGGVNNEYLYEEIIFITGKPIKFIGEVKITEKEKEKDNTLTVTYKFDLEPEDKTIKGSLKRTISYETLFTPKNDKGQTIGQTEVSKY